MHLSETLEMLQFGALFIGQSQSAKTSLAYIVRAISNFPSGMSKPTALISHLQLHCPRRLHSQNAYLQERPRTPFYFLLFAPANFATTDPARTQESRQGWHSGACQGQRPARKGPEAHVDCKYPHLHLNFHRKAVFDVSQ
jgi:hypothetical protein